MSILDEWRRGTLLSEAWWRFAPPKLRVALENEKREKMRAAGAPRSKPSSQAEAIQSLQDVGLAVVEALKADGIAQREMQEAVRRRLETGRLLAFGIPIAPEPSTDPRQIPPTMFEDRFIRWSKGEIGGGGFEYRSVRVLRPSRRRLLPAQTTPPPDNKSPRKAGRPGVEHILREIVRELASSGQFQGKYVKEKEGLVRDLARERQPGLFPKPSQPSRQTIRNALGAEGCLAVGRV